ncbi:hypothetical protein EFD56_00450 [Rhizobium phaseoli]|nr:hypothetical protein EFD56_00450 [Rhizobium phaseoli]
MTLLSTAGGDRERYEAHTGAQKLSAIEFAKWRRAKAIWLVWQAIHHLGKRRLTVYRNSDL